MLNCKHKILIGYQYMVLPEGSRILKHIFVTRWPEPQEIIQYDNGTNLILLFEQLIVVLLPGGKSYDSNYFKVKVSSKVLFSPRCRSTFLNSTR